MSEGERQTLAMKLYDDWQETDTSDSLEIYCYQQGRADREKELQGIKDLGKLYSEIRADAIDEFVKALPTEYCNYCNQIACDGGRIGSIQECASVSMLVEVMKDLAKQLKEQK